MRPAIARLLIVVLIVSALDPVWAVSWHVRKDGHDTNCTGQADAAYDGAGGPDPCAFLTVQKAADANTVAGDTVTIHSGVYQESVTWTKSGAAGNPIIIQGDPNDNVTVRAAAHKSVTDPNSWVSLGPVLSAYGIYRYNGLFDPNGVSFTCDPNDVASVTQRVYGYVSGAENYQNDRVGLIPYKYKRDFMSRSTDYYSSTVPYYAGPGTWVEKRCDTGGGTWGAHCDCSSGCSPGVNCKYTGNLLIRLAKTPEMGEYETRYGVVFPTSTTPAPPDFDSEALGVNPYPGDYAIDFTKGTTGGGGGSDYTWRHRASYVTIKNITLDVAKSTVLLDPGSMQNGNTFDGVTVWVGDDGFRFSGSGDPNTVIKNSRIYGDVPLWLAWSDAKSNPKVADLMRPDSISMDGANDDNITVEYSHLRGGHDGFSTVANQSGHVYRYNRVESFADDAFEVEGDSLGRIEAFGNFILNSLTCFAPGQDSTGIAGPILFYRNVCSQLHQPLVNREGKNRDGSCSRPDCTQCSSTTNGCTINTWNGSYRHGHEYALKQHSPNTFYYHNTHVLIDSASGGIQIMPGDDNSPCDNCYAMDNLLIKINGAVQGTTSDHTATGEVINYNAYWKINDRDGAKLAWGQDTLAGACSARGYECNSISGDPLLPNLIPEDPNHAGMFDKTVNGRWILSDASYEFPLLTDFIPDPNSPLVNAGAALPVHGTFGTLPDLFSADTDIGAFPFDVDPNTLNIFPFLLGANPVGPTANPGGGGMKRTIVDQAQ